MKWFRILIAGAALMQTRRAHAAGESRRFPLEETTIADVQAAYRSGALSATQLVQAYLARIRAYDRAGPKLHAVLCLNPSAAAEAAALDRHLRGSGMLVGPLHGIPVLLKDNIDTRDMPTTGGSLSLAGYVPRADAAIARRLRAAGAILLAKVNLHEFAIWGETVSSLGGQTLNPYDLTRTPGGSSGGTGAGVAANFALAGIGTDTVNSIRSPASATALVGIRPTIGLVSRAGIIPYSFTQDAAGPMARSVTDAVKLLNVLAGQDASDPATAASLGKVDQDYTRHLRVEGVRDKRIGVLRSLFGTAAVHAEVNAIAAVALDDLRKLGATLVELEAPELDSSNLSSEVSVHLYELKPSLNAYLARARAPMGSLEEVIASGRFHPNIGENLREAQSLELGDAYQLRLRRRAELQQHILAMLANQHLDALVFPHQKRLVVPVGETQVERNGVLAAVTGFPSIVVPAGFSPPTATAPIGVPVGLELLGTPWSEGTLIEIAYGYEQATRHRRPPPTVPPLDRR
jgi:amidase